jgi:hypothetical protein
MSERGAKRVPTLPEANRRISDASFVYRAVRSGSREEAARGRRHARPALLAPPDDYFCEGGGERRLGGVLDLLFEILDGCRP